jgi:hypothetical protein
MKKIIRITLLISVLFSFVGCSSYLKIANGAYSDISLTRDPDGYTVKRLPEVKETGRAFWGIPINNSNKKQGLIFRFNGINLEQANGFWPTISLIGMSTVGSLFVAGLINQNWFWSEEYTTLLLSTAITLPITGAINNAIWSKSAYQTAAFNLNSKLLAQNPDVDVFLNPKYEVYKNNGLWTQETIIKANVMGATIIVDEDLNAKIANINTSNKIVSEKAVDVLNIPTSAKQKVDTIKEGIEKPIINSENQKSNNQESLEVESIIKSDIKTDIKNESVNQIQLTTTEIQSKTTNETEVSVKENIKQKKSKKEEPDIFAEKKENHSFNVGDVVSFSERLFVIDKWMNMEIKKGEIFKINGDNIYVEYTFNKELKKTKKKYSDIKLVEKFIDESNPKTNSLQDNSSSYDYKVGDIVTFVDRVDINGKFYDLVIPKGEIIKIYGEYIYVMYSIKDVEYKTTKNKTEIKLVE